MAKDATEVLSPDANCEFYFAPEGTTLPTTAEEALDAAFASAGYLADPPDFAPDRPTKDITAWNADDPVRTLIEKSNVEVTLKFLQTNSIAHEFFWGKGTWESDGGTGSVWTPDTGDVIKAMVGHITDGDNVFRLAMARVSVSSVGALNLARAEGISYEVTLKRLTGDFVQLFNWVPDGVDLGS